MKEIKILEIEKNYYNTKNGDDFPDDSFLVLEDNTSAETDNLTYLKKDGKYSLLIDGKITNKIVDKNIFDHEFSYQMPLMFSPVNINVYFLINKNNIENRNKFDDMYWNVLYNFHIKFISGEKLIYKRISRKEYFNSNINNCFVLCDDNADFRKRFDFDKNYSFDSYYNTGCSLIACNKKGFNTLYKENEDFRKKIKFCKIKKIKEKLV